MVFSNCPGSASSASALTLLVKGKTVNKAKKITEVNILTELDGLPKAKRNCAKLSIKALRKAIAEYEKLKGRSEM